MSGHACDHRRGHEAFSCLCPPLSAPIPHRVRLRDGSAASAPDDAREQRRLSAADVGAARRHSGRSGRSRRGTFPRPAHRTRTGHAVCTFVPRIPRVRRLAHGPETRRPDAREVSGPDTRGRPGDDLRDLGWPRHLSDGESLHQPHASAIRGRAPGRNSHHRRRGER